MKAIPGAGKLLGNIPLVGDVLGQITDWLNGLWGGPGQPGEKDLPEDVTYSGDGYGAVYLQVRSEEVEGPFHHTGNDVLLSKATGMPVARWDHQGQAFAELQGMTAEGYCIFARGGGLSRVDEFIGAEVGELEDPTAMKVARSQAILARRLNVPGAPPVAKAATLWARDHPKAAAVAGVSGGGLVAAAVWLLGR
jgi:hypothetical protein